MKRVIRKNLGKGYRLAKKVANRNKHTKNAAQSVKRLAIKIANAGEAREIYNVASFYPTIQDYFYQIKDSDFPEDPLISILLPTYNTPEEYLRECIESILIQSYSKWELCIADDHSPDKNVIKIIKEYQQKDDRIKLIVRTANGHISEATNSALAIANGKFVALMDHDDVLWPNALYEMVKAIRDNQKVDFIYSDEDKIDGTGKIHSYPFLKPDFSPEFLESCNYITHFSCIRMSIMKEVGGFRKGYEGAQDWDLFIRISEITNNIVHIPKLLYSWRIHAASTASDTDAKPYVYEAQLKLLEDHITRTGMSGVVETGIITQHRTIKYAVDPQDTLSVFVEYSSPVATRRLFDSMIANEAGVRLEVTIVYGGDLVEKIEHEQVRYVHSNSVYEAISSSASSDYILVIKDHIEIASKLWAKTFIGDLQLKNIGLIGPVLLDSTKQIVLSAGLGLGYGESGMINMLEGMSFDDPHYTRGLYAKSRRNVSAVNPAVYAFKKDKIASMSAARTTTEAGLLLTEKGNRHIYTPYVQVICYDLMIDDELKLPASFEDKLLNPNFNHSNGRMEVRA